MSVLAYLASELMASIAFMDLFTVGRCTDLSAVRPLINYVTVSGGKTSPMWPVPESMD